jgi:thymidylate synthase ThyX
MEDFKSQQEIRKQLELMLNDLQNDLKRAFAEMEAIRKSTSVLQGKNWSTIVHLN